MERLDYSNMTLISRAEYEKFIAEEKKKKPEQKLNGETKTGSEPKTCREMYGVGVAVFKK